MKTIQLTMVCTFLVGCRASDPPEAAQVHQPFACNVDALTEVERHESHDLQGRMAKAILNIEELPAGYAFRIDEATLPLAGLSRWIDLERRCCPFFHFDLEVMPDAAGTWLRLTGASGVKEFIDSELGTKGRS
jgi:hypothetical protein